MESIQEKSQFNRTYFNDTENAGEMARLMIQARYITKGSGGPFPVHLPLSSVHDVLDIGCGPGEWVTEVASCYPSMQITGIDISASMIEVATMLATQSSIPNVHFRKMDATGELDFPDASFDLIHARLVFSFMPRDHWPDFVQECWRLLRPGGMLILTENEMMVTSSPALEEMSVFFMKAQYLAGQNFSPFGGYSGVTPMLPRFMADADFEVLQEKGFALNYSAGTQMYQSCCENARIAFQLMQPFLVKWGVTTPEYLQDLHPRMVQEMMSPDFSALHYFYQVTGRKAFED